MKHSKFYILGALSASLSLLSTADAYDVTAVGKVTTVETSMVSENGNLNIQINTNVGAACPSGVWLKYKAKHAPAGSKWQNKQATLSGLLTAQVSGRDVQVYVESATCNIEFIHFK